MGKLLFVNTNRVNGWFGVVLCFGAIVLGLVWTAMAVGFGRFHADPGDWKLFLPTGLVFVAGGAMALKYCLVVATQRTTLYEHGFVSESIFGRLELLYADLQGISRGAIARSGVRTTVVRLVTKGKRNIRISRETFLNRQDEQMATLVENACRDLAQRWIERLRKEQEIDWMMERNRPVLRLRKDGVLAFAKDGSQEFVPFSHFGIEDVPGTLDCWILNMQKRVRYVNTAWPSFYAGIHALELLKKSSAPTTVL